MSQGSLPRGHALGEYYMVAKEGSGRYDSVHGAHHKCFPYPAQTISYFGMVALFDVFMQNFFKVSQESNKNVLAFATGLKGTLNLIRLQCLRRMMDLKAQQHLKDFFFNGVKNVFATLSGTCTVPLTSHIPNQWLLPRWQRVKVRRPRKE